MGGKHEMEYTTVIAFHLWHNATQRAPLNRKTFLTLLLCLFPVHNKHQGILFKETLSEIIYNIIHHLAIHTTALH